MSEYVCRYLCFSLSFLSLNFLSSLESEHIREMYSDQRE